MAMTLGVDIGGTKIAAGMVADDGSIVAMSRRDTPASDPDAIEATVAEIIEDLIAEHAVSGVGIAAAGFVSEDRSAVRFAPNIAWRERPIAQALKARTGIDVVVENDANAAAWAEYRFGAGRGHEHVTMVTLGTGLGGGIIIGGRLLRGAHGAAAEIGHVRAVPDGRQCGCGNRGCWEQYIAGRALEREAEERATADPDWAPGLLQLAAGHPDGITGPMVTELAMAGDSDLVALLAEYGRRVGAFVASMVAVLDPAVVVIGGGVSKAGDLLLGPAQEGFLAQLSARGHRPAAEIRLAELGNAAGLVGVADLARTRS